MSSQLSQSPLSSVRPPQQQQEQQQQAPITILFDQNPTIQKLFPDFVSPSTSSAEMQVLVQAITTEIVEAAKTSDAGPVDVTLVPILRGALPMYVAAQTLFPKPGCVLVRCSKANGTREVKVDWLGRRPFPLEPKNGHILLLDTVIATGGTILKICDELMGLSGGKEKYVTILSCYVFPIGLAAVSKHPLVKEIFVGAMAETVDENGYLVPYPGDIGDKLFGTAQNA